MRLGIDIGGTFTDLVGIGDDGALTIRKVLSTTDDYSRSIRQALPELLDACGSPAGAVREVIHGTTVATNAILERKGAPTALITTRGFRDVLELRRIRMPELYNWHWDKPPDLVERRLRFEVTERIGARGEVLTPLDLDEASHLVEEIIARKIESLAVCLINSYANPAHEEALAQLIRSRHPSVIVSISTEILREVKEYERTATTVVNAYVAPIVRGYIESLSRTLRDLGIAAPLLIMQSNGGVMTAEACLQRPVFMIESGPAAGVIASHALATRLDVLNAITFDMGGTTAKASIIEGGKLSTAAEYEVGSSLSLVSRLIKGGGHLVRVPAIDVAEVGAGGGSIAWIDEGGALNVGPESAGASPGPVCYGQGGSRVTSTDADLILGYINPDGLVGGALELDRAQAEEAVRNEITSPLSMDLLGAAHGVHLMANSNMMRAVRAVSTERGRDLRDYVLIAFGGSGPVHACQMALSLEMEEVIVPPHPGVYSAFGLLSADITHSYSQTYLKKSHEVDLATLNGLLTRIEKEVFELLRSEGFGEQDIHIDRHADVRYSGQSYELIVPIPSGVLNWSSITDIEKAFDAEHERTYGHRGGAGEEYTFVNFRIVGRVRKETVCHPPAAAKGFEPTHRSRRAYFGPSHDLLEAPVLGRADLRPERTEGPLLIDEYDSTTVVPPGWGAWLDLHGNIRIRSGSS